ncbi:glycoside hydrolase family 26 protein [Brachybacterium squillarum]|uniref:glycoside hydrolase family 26 protein n=1 Tax=Brachybacterium squillarum TaxID=661979 RepID=UPI002221777A|nr:glycoside hydrolase family 26 protein [Brachybacterium squillarum]MCW1803740.1 glycoside hydrolase family 26 protein [Brachybacterium squillarum]
MTAPLRRRSLLLGTALAGLTLTPAGAVLADGPPVSITVADPEATARTRSLFAALRDRTAQGILLGHQEDLLMGSSFSTPDGTASDVRAATGDHPAVIGFDTPERVGMSREDREQGVLDLARSIQQAHRVGAISTMTLHMENLATGGDFYDTTGDALRAVLPGGGHHAALVEHLDRFATTALHATDDTGEPIPIILRPWHENAGAWFWWGSGNGTPGEYIELFRFTVEHLRDARGVHNLLYAFSPGGGFGGDREAYLRTYPGDDFVDVLGCDTYDGSGLSDAYARGLVADLAMMAAVAEEKGKISALTEFGIDGGVRPDGENASLTWYTDLLRAMLSDDAAARTAYMLTWANYGGDAAPYTPVDGEMLADFRAFHDDPATVFAADLPVLTTTRTRTTTPVVAHLARPADGSRAATGPVTLRAAVTGLPGRGHRVTVSTDEGPAGAAEITLTPPSDASPWWTGTWEPVAEELTNTTRELTLRVHRGGRVLLTVRSVVVLGEEPELPPGVVDDFESYGDGTALERTWVAQTVNELRLLRSEDGAEVGDGEAAMGIDYSFAAQDYTGAGRSLEDDWTGRSAVEAWIAPDGSGNRMVLQLVAGGIAFEAYPPLDGTDPYLTSTPMEEWRPAPWDTTNADRLLDAEALSAVTRFSVFVNAEEGGAESGSISVDAIRAVP